MAEPFLNPPQGETSLRAPQLLDILGNVLNSLFGVDPTTDSGRTATLKAAMGLGPAMILKLGTKFAPELTVRLYRGEGRIDPTGPYWVDPQMNKLAGRWFTTDESVAQRYAGDAASTGLGPGRVVAADVPEKVFRSGLVVNHPIGGIRALGNAALAPSETILPEEWSQQIKPLYNMKRVGSYPDYNYVPDK